MGTEEFPDSNRGVSQDGVATRNELAPTRAHGGSAIGVSNQPPFLKPHLRFLHVPNIGWFWECSCGRIDITKWRGASPRDAYFGWKACNAWRFIGGRLEW